MDRKRFPQITPAELEYRAKLVELHFSGDPGLLQKFLSEADESKPDDSHAVAPQGSDESLQIRTKRCFRAFRRGRWSYSARIRGNWRKSTGESRDHRTGKLL